MEKFFVKVLGVVWIVVAVLYLFIIVKKPYESGMAIVFFLTSLAMAYSHLSGKFDPDPPAPSNTAQPR